MRYEEKPGNDAGAAGSGAQTRGGDAGNSRSLLTGCLIVLLAGGVVGILLIVAMGLFLVTGTVSAFQMGQPTGERYRFQEVTLQGDKDQPKVVQIPLQGFMTTASMGTETTSAAVFRARLEKAREDENVRAILLNVNSGGGGVTASDIMTPMLPVMVVGWAMISSQPADT